MPSQRPRPQIQATRHKEVADGCDPVAGRLSRGGLPRFTSRALGCAHPPRFIGRGVLVTGGCHRHKAANYCNMRPIDIRSGQGELALDTFPGVPFSAKLCHSFFDITLRARVRTTW